MFNHDNYFSYLTHFQSELCDENLTLTHPHGKLKNESHLRETRKKTTQ